MKWISVKDKLSKYGQEVLCYAQSKDKTFYSIIECSYMPRKYFADVGIEYNDFAVRIFGAEKNYVILSKGEINSPESMDRYFYFGDITHWMPLPEMPEEVIVNE